VGTSWFEVGVWSRGYVHKMAFIDNIFIFDITSISLTGEKKELIRCEMH
jgi:hypothetical protein